MHKTRGQIARDLQSVIDKCEVKSTEYLRTAKSYNCKSNAELRAGLVKGAAVLRMVSAWLREVVRDDKVPLYGQHEPREDTTENGGE